MKKRIFAAAMTARTLEILVYEEIGEDYWSGRGVTAGSVANAITLAGGPAAFDRISIRINSPGGSCFDGVAIYNLLRAQGKPIDVFIDGIAASAASIIAMAGDTISVGVGAMIMIHNAMWGCFGDATALRQAADVIENISVTAGEIYVARTKNDAATVKELMDAETWMGATVAIEKGFADKLMDQDPDAQASAHAVAKLFNYKPFQHAPAALKVKEAPRADINEDCECDCDPCQTTGCEGCTNGSCTAVGCSCPQHEEMKAPAVDGFALRERRLRLYELT